MNAMLQGVTGYQQQITELYTLESSSLQRFQRYHLTDTWTEDNPDATYPRIKFASKNDNNRKDSDFWIRNCNYLRLRSLTIGYALPAKLLQKKKINSVSIALQGSNLFTISSLENGIDPETDVTIQWASEHAECLAALQADPSIVCMLPQPFATSALAKVEGARIALDLTEVWDETVAANGGNSQLITGVAVARSAFASEHPAAVEELLDAYAASVDFVNDGPSTAAQLIEAADIVTAQVAERAIPYCNIVCMTGAEMAGALTGYLQTLYDADPASVGGAMPGDDFYYGA